MAGPLAARLGCQSAAQPACCLRGAIREQDAVKNMKRRTAVSNHA